MNFLNAELTAECYEEFHNKRWEEFNSKKARATVLALLIHTREKLKGPCAAQISMLHCLICVCWSRLRQHPHVQCPGGAGSALRRACCTRRWPRCATPRYRAATGVLSISRTPSLPASTRTACRSCSCLRCAGPAALRHSCGSVTLPLAAPSVPCSWPLNLDATAVSWLIAKRLPVAPGLRCSKVWCRMRPGSRCRQWRCRRGSRRPREARAVARAMSAPAAGRASALRERARPHQMLQRLARDCIPWQAPFVLDRRRRQG